MVKGEERECRGSCSLCQSLGYLVFCFFLQFKVSLCDLCGFEICSVDAGAFPLLPEINVGQMMGDLVFGLVTVEIVGCRGE